MVTPFENNLIPQPKNFDLAECRKCF